MENIVYLGILFLSLVGGFVTYKFRELRRFEKLKIKEKKVKVLQSNKNQDFCMNCGYSGIKCRCNTCVCCGREKESCKRNDYATLDYSKLMKSMEIVDKSIEKRKL